ALPVDPRLGRMIIEGNHRGCLRDVLVLAAALTIADPRERPADSEAQARQQHARFTDKKSDFMSYLNLWRYLREMQQEMSGNQFRRMCKSEYLNFLRVREWQDLVSQLKQVAAAHHMHVSTSDGDEDQIHRSLLAGLLSQVGMADPLNVRTYLGPRGAQFYIFPGSGLFKSTPRWIMAAELVDTSRLWAREVAIIDPVWIEQQAAHLVKRTYAEPHWERNRASVVASETVTLYGLPIIAGRKVQYGKVDPQLSREIFIRQALVEGDWSTRHHFFAANSQTMQAVADLENKSRRRDILIDDESLYAFYDARIPADVTSGRHFDSWWKKARHQLPDLLTATTDDLVRAGAQLPSDAEFPDVWTDGRRPLELTYQFDPESLGSQSSPTIDGISVDIPLVMLHETMPRKFDWLVPGRREELIIAMIRTLPKALRRQVVPAPDRARQILPQLDPEHDELTESVARQLRATTGAAIEADDFVLSKLPRHLQMTFRVIDDTGSVLGTGQDLAALKLSLAPVQSNVVSQRSGSIEQADVRDWNFGSLLESFALVDGPDAPLGYPSLVIEADHVALRVLTSQAHRNRAMPPAVRELIRLQVPASSSKTLRAIDSADRLALSSAPHPNAAALFDDCAKATIDAILSNCTMPTDSASFAEQLQRVKSELAPQLIDTVRAVAGTLRARNGAMDALANYSDSSFDRSKADINAQLEFLFGSEFVSTHGTDRLSDIARYCEGIAVRLDRLKGHRTMDETNTAIITDVLSEFDQFVRSFSALEPVPDGVTHIRWMIEEFRLSLFAQAISTAYPVSEKRIYKAMDAF
ncbi:MAG: ATP-dependent RNA helicase HrpA, partial [Antricoccus sp.]